MFTDVSVFMRFVAKDRVGWSVCVSVSVSPAKMAENGCAVWGDRLALAQGTTC